MSVYDDLPKVYGTGEVLTDNRSDWKKEKLRSTAVSIVMLTEKRKQRMSDCSTALEFAADAEGNKRLHRANFCKDRMCPACQRRRSLKVFHQIKECCTSLLKERPSVQFLMLTLTIPNVSEDELSSSISHMFKSWDRLLKRKEFNRAVIGWFRSLEVTSEKKRSDYYHPHFHVLLAVPSYYFKTKGYITHGRWLELWQEATRQPEITQVDIRRVKPNRKQSLKGASEFNDQGGSSIEAISAASAEVGKYATKPSDYLKVISPDDYQADSNIVQVLAEALKHRRIIAFSKEFKRHLQNNEEIDSDSVDLVHTGDEGSDIESVVVQIFRWHANHRIYIG